MRYFLSILFSFIFLSNLYSQDSIDSYYYDGKLIKFYNTEHYFVSAYLEPIRYYGRYYSIHLSIMNKDVTRFDVIPSSFLAGYEYDGNMKAGEILSFDKYNKLVKSKQNWQEAMMGVSIGFMSFVNSHKELFSAKISSGKQVSTITVYDNGERANQQMLDDAGQIKMQHLDDLETIKDGYLKRHTLFKNKELIGYINIRYKKCDRLTFTIPLNDESFVFEWKFEHKRRKKTIGDDVYK